VKRWLLIGGLLIAAPLVASLPLLSVTPSRDTDGEILVRLAGDGRVELWHGEGGAPQSRLSLDDGRFARGDGPGNLATLAALRDHFRRLTEAGERTPSGVSVLRMRIETSPLTPVTVLLWLVQAGVRPESKVASYEFSTRGRLETVRLEVPHDSHPGARIEAVTLRLRLRLAQDAEAEHVTVAFDPIEDEFVGEEFVSRWPNAPAGDPVQLVVDPRGTPRAFAAIEERLAATRRLAPGHQAEMPVEVEVLDPWAMRARTLVDLMRVIQRVEGLVVEVRGVPEPRAPGENR
jgi:hypothetical protein